MVSLESEIVIVWVLEDVGCVVLRIWERFKDS